MTRLLKTKEAMARLGIKDIATLKSREREGLIEIIREKPNCWKIRESEVEAYPDRVKARAARHSIFHHAVLTDEDIRFLASLGLDEDGQRIPSRRRA